MRWIIALFKSGATLTNVATATHLHGHYSVKAPFHQQVKSNESEKTKVVVPSVLNYCAAEGEKKWEDERGEKAFSAAVVECTLTTARAPK